MRKLGYEEYLSQDKPRRNNFKYIIPVIILVVFSLIGFRYIKKYIPTASLSTGGEMPLTSFYLEEQTSIFRNNLGRWMRLPGPLVLNPGDRMMTGKVGRTIFRFEGNNNIRIGPDTDFIYTGYSNGTYNIALNRGQIWLETFSGKYRVESKTGWADMEKCAALFKAADGQDMKVFCNRGIILVFPRKFPERRVTLLGGQKTVIKPNFNISSPSDYKPMALGSWGDWNLSFSPANLKPGDSPPAYKLVISRKIPEIVFEKSNHESNCSGKKLNRAGNGIDKWHKEGKQTTRKLPRRKITTHIYTKNEDPCENPGEDTQKPGVPDENAVSGGSNNDSPTNPPVDVKEEPSEKSAEVIDHRAIEREYRLKKHKGAFYYLENERRLKANPAGVPGLGIGSEPVGPAEITEEEYEQGVRPSPPP